MPQTVRTMKAVYLDASKGNNAPRYYVETAEPLPPLERHRVLVRIKACGLSLPNERILRELFRKKSSQKGRFAVGQDIAGIVTQIGSDVTTLEKGDEVVGIIPLDYSTSGCAEYVVLHEFDVVRKPAHVSFPEAAGCIGDAVKAYTALHYLGRMASGDTVMVLEGATAFGGLAIQLAHHWGAKVLTTCSSDEERRQLQALEPQIAQVIDLHKKNMSLKAACMLETGDLGVDVIIDQGVHQYLQHNSNVCEAGKSQLLPSKHDVISCLAVGGRWITSKANLQLDPPNSRLLFLKCATVGFLFEQAWMLSSAQQGRYQHILMDIMEKVANKIIRPNIRRTVPFESVAETFKSLINVRVGKVVMTVD